jgi:HNH endonuclease
LQRGMNFRLGRSYSVILMSLRPGAPYADRVEEDGRLLIYEGHDLPRTRGGPDPKSVDQPLATPLGRLTQNGLFVEAARKFLAGQAHGEPVKVYEKIKAGIWAYAGVFKLVDAWDEASGGRRVFKFKLELVNAPVLHSSREIEDLSTNRIIPTAVKLEVWKRDKGRCVKCGRRDNLHFDHVLPYSKGGSSLVAENIQLLCARHNLAKRDKIE